MEETISERTSLLWRVNAAKSPDELRSICMASADWLMGLMHSEPWVYGDIADAILRKRASF